MIAGQQRQNLPFLLYKNTHLQILIYKKTQQEMRLKKPKGMQGIQNAECAKEGKVGLTGTHFRCRTLSVLRHAQSNVSRPPFFKVAFRFRVARQFRT